MICTYTCHMIFVWYKAVYQCVYYIKANLVIIKNVACLAGCCSCPCSDAMALRRCRDAHDVGAPESFKSFSGIGGFYKPTLLVRCILFVFVVHETRIPQFAITNQTRIKKMSHCISWMLRSFIRGNGYQNVSRSMEFWTGAHILGDEEDYKGKLQKVVFLFLASRGLCNSKSYVYIPGVS